MVFSSQIFIFIFLPFTILGYYICPKKFRNYMLLAASLFFYAWGGINYIPILLLSIFINYIFGLLIAKFKENGGLCKGFLIVGILLNFAILFYYKYYDFTVSNINELFGMEIPFKNIILPIGISFFTFQGVSYIIDIYRNDAKVNKNIFSVALYISLFPQLIAGPIVKYKTVSHQINNRKESAKAFSYGIERFIIGFAKKVLIADVLADIARGILFSFNGIDTPTAWIGILCYTLQIYFDFSGYSDMAIGLGQFFGFTFMENFNYPYISKSVTEFWRRWHISLSTWFKEYLYIPLGGNRTGKTYRNLLIVFFATGLWHGASWNFIVWGLWHGLFLVIERLIRNKNWYIRIPNFIKWMITTFVVMIGWVFFLFTNFGFATSYLKVLFGLVNNDVITFNITYYMNLRVIFWLVMSVVLATPLISNIIKKFSLYKHFENIKTLVLAIIFIISIIFMVNSTYSPFIYFQF